MYFCLNFIYGLNITIDGDKSTIQTPFEGNFMRMADKLEGEVQKTLFSPNDAFVYSIENDLFSRSRS
jgi:hypothetical protein